VVSAKKHFQGFCHAHDSSSWRRASETSLTSSRRLPAQNRKSNKPKRFSFVNTTILRPSRIESLFTVLWIVVHKRYDLQSGRKRGARRHSSSSDVVVTWFDASVDDLQAAAAVGTGYSNNGYRPEQHVSTTAAISSRLPSYHHREIVTVRTPLMSSQQESCVWTSYNDVVNDSCASCTVLTVIAQR